MTNSVIELHSARTEGLEWVVNGRMKRTLLTGRVALEGTAVTTILALYLFVKSRNVVNSETPPGLSTVKL